MSKLLNDHKLTGLSSLKRPHCIRFLSKRHYLPKMSIFSLTFLLFFTFEALANDTHMQLALKFEDMSSSSDKAALVDSMMPYIQMQTDGDEAEVKKIRSYLIQSLQSEDYRKMKANIYKRQFTKEELELLIELVTSPAYKLLNAKRNDIAIDTQQSLLIFIQNSMQQYEKDN